MHASCIYMCFTSFLFPCLSNIHNMWQWKRERATVSPLTVFQMMMMTVKESTSLKKIMTRTTLVALRVSLPIWNKMETDKKIYIYKDFFLLLRFFCYFVCSCYFWVEWSLSLNSNNIVVLCVCMCIYTLFFSKKIFWWNGTDGYGRLLKRRFKRKKYTRL